MNAHHEPMTSKPTETRAACQRCDGELLVDGLCQDQTCPFSDHTQDDDRGWSGHPERDSTVA